MRRMAQYLEDCDRQHRRNQRARASQSVWVQNLNRGSGNYTKNSQLILILKKASNRQPQSLNEELQNTPIRRHLVENNPNYDVRIVRVPRSNIPYSVKVFFVTGLQIYSDLFKHNEIFRKKNDFQASYSYFLSPCNIYGHAYTLLYLLSWRSRKISKRTSKATVTSLNPR